MKLLSKNEIAKGKAQEQRQTIDEGLKIAKRVDALRETQSQEEASLEAFRAKTLSSIQLEIASKTKERDELEKAVRDIERRKEEALKPLKSEWDKIGVEKDKLAVIKESLAQKSEQLDVKDKNLANKLEEVRLEEERVEDEKQIISTEHREATNSRILSDKILSEAKEYSAKRQKEDEEKSKTLAIKEAELKTKEELLTTRVASLNKKETYLNERERFINDKYRTLQRTQQRLNG